MNEDNFDQWLDEHTTKAQIEAAKREKAAGEWVEPLPAENVTRDYPKVQRELDLHGHTVDEARLEIPRFLKSAKSRQIKTVRIITGRGWHSVDFKAVLPEVTEKLLAQLKREDVVRQFKLEKTQGSFVVYLVH